VYVLIRGVVERMKSLEIRRHSVRNKPSAHLSFEGRDLARRVGREAGPFEHIIASPAPRAVETATEMGFAPTELRPSWLSLGDEVGAEIEWPAPFAEYASRFRVDSATRRKGLSLLEEIRGVLGHTSESRSSLIVTHGGLPELASVAAFPNANHQEWGAAVRCLEGVRITMVGTRFRKCDVLRLPLNLGRM
jgi:hypothetical protein